MLWLALFSMAHAELPEGVVQWLANRRVARQCYDHVRGLGVDESSAALVVTALYDTSDAEFSARCNGLTSAAEVREIAREAPDSFAGRDGVTEDHTRRAKSADTKAVATRSEGTPTSEFYLLGEPVAGIPQTFVTRVVINNPGTTARRRFVADVGTILIVPNSPHLYQYVVVVRGLELTLAPGESREEYVWSMCVQNGTAYPPNGQPLMVAGVLPPSARDTLMTYRDSESATTRFKTREVLISLIRSAIAGAATAGG